MCEMEKGDVGGCDPKRLFLLPTFTQLPYVSAYRHFKQVADITVAFKRRTRLR